MRTLNRYTTRLFLRPFLWTLISFVGIFLIAELFQSLKIILDNKVPFTTVCLYFIYLIPYVVVQVALPVSVLLGAIFCLSEMTKHRELVIIKASGVSVSRIVVPLLLCALTISALAFLVNEYLVPQSTIRRNNIRYYEIEKRIKRVSYDHISFNTNNLFFYIGNYDASLNKIENIQIIERRGDKSRTISVRIDAPQGKVEKDSPGNGYAYILENVIVRRFSAAGELKDMQEIARKKVFLQYSPDDFKQTKNPEEMNIPELKKHIAILRDSGNYNIRFSTALYDKMALPLASFFICLVGIPFALHSKRSGIATGFGMSIVISFSYWIMMSLSLSWAKQSILHPSLAAFLPNILCLILGVFLLRKTPT